jgi:hypothetical protein
MSGFGIDIHECPAKMGRMKRLWQGLTTLQVKGKVVLTYYSAAMLVMMVHAHFTQVEVPNTVLYLYAMVLGTYAGTNTAQAVIGIFSDKAK